MLTDQRFEELLTGALAGDAKLTRDLYDYIYTQHGELTPAQKTKLAEDAEFAMLTTEKSAAAAVLRSFVHRKGSPCNLTSLINALDTWISKGDSYAMYERARLHFKAKENKLGIKQHQMAVSQGNVQAEYYLGFWFEKYNDPINIPAAIASYEKVIAREPKHFLATLNLGLIHYNDYSWHYYSARHNIYCDCSGCCYNLSAAEKSLSKAIPRLQRASELYSGTGNNQAKLYLDALTPEKLARYNNRMRLQQARDDLAKKTQANQDYGELPLAIREKLNEKLSSLEEPLLRARAENDVKGRLDALQFIITNKETKETADALQFILENASKLGHRVCAHNVEVTYPNAARNMPEVISALRQSVQASRAYLHRPLPLEPASLTTIEADADEILILIHRALANEQYWKGVTPVQKNLGGTALVVMREYLQDDAQSELSSSQKLLWLQAIALDYVPSPSERVSFFGSDACMPTFFCRLVARQNKSELARFVENQNALMGEGTAFARREKEVATQEKLVPVDESTMSEEQKSKQAKREQYRKERAKGFVQAKEVTESRYLSL